MAIIICPGVHNPALTDKFLTCLYEKITNIPNNSNYVNILTLPTDGILPLSGLHILEFLRSKLKSEETAVIFIGFSAGVVGAIAAAHLWQLQSGHVKAFIAIDGWGVPLFGNFPIHRISHDYFTHWSSLLLGGGENNFYADPGVDHLQMWENPQAVQGWSVSTINSSVRLSAIEFIQKLLNIYNANQTDRSSQ
ncbi:hypothetical protein NIES4071_70430 [Calothrix sp. NIES-4071]|nr:hypothetical protein NIES4071_70430 [Calothrix sp. NIES-4071]BAZ61318.1 hypothetical protein NIES4105_70380 [Calothrix sp. NIES-4105]